MQSRNVPRRWLLLGWLLLLLAPLDAYAAPDPIGYWTTVDDDGKTVTSVVQIYARRGKLHGKIVELINPREKNPKCSACEGDKHDQPILGMEILWGLEKDGDEWSGGRILDPRNGTAYKCYIEVVDGGKRLKVRGYVGIALLGRTQYWRRTERKAQPPS
jgi:uncharacterized protein (DUF2147 family)